MRWVVTFASAEGPGVYFTEAASRELAVGDAILALRGKHGGAVVVKAHEVESETRLDRLSHRPEGWQPKAKKEAK